MNESGGGDTSLGFFSETTSVSLASMLQGAYDVNKSLIGLSLGSSATSLMTFL
jgi:hypothetical protein